MEYLPDEIIKIIYDFLPTVSKMLLTKKLFKTYDEFWNLRLSNKLLKEKKGDIDLIFSANTISHIPNLKETFRGINK